MYSIGEGMISGDSIAAVNNVSLYLLIVCLVLLVGITGTMIYFVIRYSRKNNPSPKNIPSNATLEITWIVIPTILVLSMFYYGWSGFKVMRTVPENAMEVNVTGRQWSWQFEYGNGKKSGELRVPVGKPVKLVITSADVNHSLFIPAFRIKEDAIPGKVNYLWFLPEKEGEFDLFCTEYCGTGHSSMVSKVVVMPTDKFSAWMKPAAQPAAEPVSGRDLLEEKGCLGCHTTDGSPLVGPTFKGIYGRQVTVITEGKERTLTVDETYLKRSILEPDEDVVKGFPDLMPEQEDNVNEKEVEQIIQYLKGLK